MKKKVQFLRGAVFTAILFAAVLSCGGGAGAGGGITYTVTANGNTSDPTNKLTFDFSDTVDGLTASDITLTSGTGSVTTGTLSGTELPVTVTNGGTITVKITKDGVESTPKTVKVFKVYAIGATGPGGGIIFYVSPASFGPGNAWNYLEADPADLGNFTWASPQHLPPNAPLTISSTGTAIGTGYANTAAILAADPDAPAAKACKNYSGGGKNDWFLPSKDELTQLYQKKDVIGGFGALGEYYQSSSERFVSTKYYRSFSVDFEGDDTKAYLMGVRPIRAF
ncbi:hypothetical protein AGMMS50230_21060 [Spirochaetia bacterium]|nr:hypothetical protein AGMMS50230_21060 [Spirochaetia bacterium]